MDKIIDQLAQICHWIYLSNPDVFKHIEPPMEFDDFVIDYDEQTLEDLHNAQKKGKRMTDEEMMMKTRAIGKLFPGCFTWQTLAK